MKVLIADDDRATCVLLSSTLKKAGMQTYYVHDGTQALDMYDQELPNVVISDWHMPGMNGLELCQRIRNRTQKTYTYFILITADNEANVNSRAAIEFGVDDILRKPLNPDFIWMRLHVAERFMNFTNELTELKTLLPICSYCKRVRNDESYWEQIEQYFREHAGAEFTHSVCPDCYNKIMRSRDHKLTETQGLDEHPHPKHAHNHDHECQGHDHDLDKPVARPSEGPSIL